MDGEKKQSGRPQAYTRESQRYIQELELRRRRQEEQRAKETSQNTGASGRSEKGESVAVRRREQENAQKIRILSVVLGVLVVVLIAAIIYEVALGHGVRETGSERMSRQEQTDAVIQMAPENGTVSGDAGAGTAEGTASGDAGAGTAEGIVSGDAGTGTAEGIVSGDAGTGTVDGAVPDAAWTYTGNQGYFSRA